MAGGMCTYVAGGRCSAAWLVAWYILVDGAVLLGAVLRQEAVGVLVYAQVIQ